MVAQSFLFLIISAALCICRPTTLCLCCLQAPSYCSSQSLSLHASLAQLAEHALRKRMVMGSIPIGGCMMLRKHAKRGMGFSTVTAQWLRTGLVLLRSWVPPWLRLCGHFVCMCLLLCERNKDAKNRRRTDMRSDPNINSALCS